MSESAGGPRRFRFSVVTTGGSQRSRRRWAEYAREIEALGFAVLQVADHYLNPTVCTPRLAAAVTTTLRVGSYVYNNDFRHPVLLAREVAEIDLLSDGRMELGLGAGWSNDEYEMVGLPFDAGRVRADRFEEAVAIIRSLHTEGRCTFQGDHYRISDCELLVEPVQHPIPLVLGGGGPRMTHFAAGVADTVAFVPRSMPGGGLNPGEFSDSAFADKIAVLNQVTAAQGHPAPERAILAFEVHRTIDDIPENAWAPRETIAAGPYALVGDTAKIIDTLIERRERWGLSHWTCWEEDLDIFTPIVRTLAGT